MANLQELKAVYPTHHFTKVLEVKLVEAATSEERERLMADYEGLMSEWVVLGDKVEAEFKAIWNIEFGNNYNIPVAELKGLEGMIDNLYKAFDEQGETGALEVMNGYRKSLLYCGCGEAKQVNLSLCKGCIDKMVAKLV